MLRRPKAVLALVLLMPALGGCQSMFGVASKSGGMPEIRQVRSAEDFAASQIEAGRKALDSRQYGLAIASFSKVQRLPEHAAAAHNGMAIAYAQIGRPDLAERFFKQAMSEAPSERRYQVNLENFYRNWPEVAVRTVRPEALAAAAPAGADFAAAPPVASVTPLPVTKEPEVAIQSDEAVHRRIAAALGAQSEPVRRTTATAARQAPAREPILATLRRAIVSAMRPRASQLAQAPVRSNPASGSTATIRFEIPETRALRISANEVRITAPQPTASDPRRRNPAVAAGTAAQPAVKRARPGYPARVVMSSGQ